ncbi:BrnT family toxin [Desulfobulbus sp. TB]|nr:BrnT family toxin [Desulfobulbus sp. TB]
MKDLYDEMLHRCTGFDWDKGNINKNKIKHKVTPSECEQIFFNQPLLVKDAVLHSEKEQRFCALGKTDKGRRLFIAFTVRKDRIRVISARDMSRKERSIYENAEKNT